MATHIIDTSFVASVGNSLDLTEFFDFAFIAPGVLLGSTALGGRGISATDDLQRVVVAGSVAATVGIEVNTRSTVGVLTGGSVAATSTAVLFQSSGTMTNAGDVSGSSGVFSNAGLTIDNSGTIMAVLDAVHSVGSMTLVNTGLITAHSTGVSVGGAANITNLGTIRGGISTADAADAILNQGLIIGSVSTGVGNDTFDNTGGRCTSIVNLGAGDDRFLGGNFADQVLGGAGLDDLIGMGGDDRFYATDADGNDDVDGGTGIDSYDASNVTLAVNVNLTTGLARIGGATDNLTGIERVWGGSGRDRLTGDAADNMLVGQDGNDLLAGGGGADRLLGGLGADGMDGGDGNDRLNGNEGRDSLDGGAGNDVLIGSYDVDVCTGGAGADRFVWTDFEEFIGVTGGLERITDFTQGEDQIDLSAIDALFATTGDQAFRFVGLAAITDFGQISYRTTGNATFVAISVNADVGFDVIRLDGVMTLSAGDFVL